MDTWFKRNRLIEAKGYLGEAIELLNQELRTDKPTDADVAIDQARRILDALRGGAK